MEKKILSAIYDQLQAELSPTQKYNELISKFENERKNFLDNIEEQNGKTLEELTDMLHEADNELNKQFFYEGFSIAVQLFIEATYKDKERDV